MTEQEKIILIISLSFLAYIAYYAFQEMLDNFMRGSEKREKKRLDNPVWKEAKLALKRLGIRGKEADDLLERVSFKIPHPARLEEILEEAFKIKRF